MTATPARRVATSHERVHVGRQTKQVHGHDGARPRRDAPRHGGHIEVERHRIDVDEDRAWRRAALTHPAVAKNE